jgi:GH43 family beta-xylosidase
MKFSLQEFIEYDINFINSQDLPTVWKIQTEWYRKHTPQLEIKELKRIGQTTAPVNADRLWGETKKGYLEFDRIFKHHVHFEQGKDNISHKKTGTERKSNDTWHFSPFLLQEADWFPLMGDHLIRAKVTYEITEVYVDPQNYFGHTGIPLIVTCKTQRYQHGGNVLPNDIHQENVS